MDHPPKVADSPESRVARLVAELHDAQERLGAACRRGSVTFRWDLHSNTIEWRGNLRRIFGRGGYDATESLDEFFAAVHPNDRPAVTAGYEACRLFGAAVDLQFRVVWPDESVRWIDDNASADVDASGATRYVSGACLNITAQKEIEAFARVAGAEIERIDEVNNEFLHRLSHELRTPLSSILGWSQVLRRPLKDPADYARGLEAIERNARLQTQIIDEFLALSRIRAPHSSATRKRAAPWSRPNEEASIRVSLAGLRVLVVDDERDARDVVKRMLEGGEAAVMTAGTADEALVLVEASHPDVLVSDIKMPNADGFELLRRVRMLGEGRGGDVPAVAVTALATPVDMKRSLQAGFLAHIPKPVESERLIEVVALAAGRR